MTASTILELWSASILEKFHNSGCPLTGLDETASRGRTVSVQDSSQESCGTVPSDYTIGVLLLLPAASSRARPRPTPSLTPVHRTGHRPESFFDFVDDIDRAQSAGPSTSTPSSLLWLLRRGRGDVSSRPAVHAGHGGDGLTSPTNRDGLRYRPHTAKEADSRKDADADRAARERRVPAACSPTVAEGHRR